MGTNGGALEASISAANTKIPAVESSIKASEEQKAQLEEELKQAQTDRSDAKTALSDATALREKEATEFAALKADFDANIRAINAAIAALEKGVAGGFLQTSAAQVLRKFVQGKESMLDADREEILSFLSSKEDSEYAPQSGEIIGILKEMGDEMSRDLTTATKEETTAIMDHEELAA